MPRYYCDYCDTYLTHDSPSVRKQHNAGYKHKANVRIYYQQYEAQLNQSLIDQRVKEHLGAFRPPVAPYPQMRPGLPMMSLPGQYPPGMQFVPGMRPPMLPRPMPGAPGYLPGPPMPQMLPPPGAPMPGGQMNGFQRPMGGPPQMIPGSAGGPPPMIPGSAGGPPPMIPGSAGGPQMIPGSAGGPPPMFAPPNYQSLPTSGGGDGPNMNALSPGDSQ